MRQRLCRNIFHLTWIAVLLLVGISSTMMVRNSAWLAEQHPQWVPTTQLLMHLCRGDYNPHSSTYVEIQKRYTGNRMSQLELNETLKTLYSLSTFKPKFKHDSIRKSTGCFMWHGRFEDTLPTKATFQSSNMDPILIDAYENSRISNDCLHWMIQLTLQEVGKEPTLLQKTEVYLWLMLYIEQKHLDQPELLELIHLIHHELKNPQSPVYSTSRSIALDLKEHGLLEASILK